MKIKETIYQGLTPRQRVGAAVAALARDDNAELKRLKETCPKKQYLATDDDYAGTMTRLMTVALAVESDLRGLALDYLSAHASAAKGERLESILCEFASIEVAWRRHTEEMGIDHAELVLASGPHHHAVGVLGKHSEGEEDETIVEHYLATIRENFA